MRGNPRNVNANRWQGDAKEDILPTNYDVLQRELPVLDVMTRNRDRRIWALAAGTSLQNTDPAVYDSTRRRSIDAKTNLPGRAHLPGRRRASSRR